MNMNVPFMTYFGDSINSKLPDEAFGLIISFLDLNAYNIVCRLNTYLRTIPEDYLKHLLWVDNLVKKPTRFENTLHINASILHCFINIMTCMPLMFKTAKSKMVGEWCKHPIERIFRSGITWGRVNSFTNKQMLNGEQRYITDGKLKLSGVSLGYFSPSQHWTYVFRLSTVLALILSGFKRDDKSFYIKEVRPTQRMIFDNRHLTINTYLEYCNGCKRYKSKFCGC